VHSWYSNWRAIGFFVLFQNICPSFVAAIFCCVWLLFRPFLQSPMSFSVFDSGSKAASSFVVSPKPPIPAFIIMSSIGASTASSLSFASAGGGRNRPPAAGRVAGHVAGNRPPPEPGSTVDSAVEVDNASATISSVWDLEHVRKEGDCKANQTWKCLWCNLSFKHWNATKVLYHLTKISGHDIRICKASHDVKSRNLYRSMLGEKENNNMGQQTRVGAFRAIVGEGQQSLAVMFEAGRKRDSSGGSCNVTNDDTTNTARQRVFASEFTIEASQASQLTMAIADFVHSSGLPFSTTQGVYFQNILKFARGVPSTYTAPNRNALSGSLLRLNFNRRMEK
jgi:hypothetical protein